MLSINIHDCRHIKISTHYPANANALTLSLRDEGGREVLNLTIYNLPATEVTALIAALGAPERLIEGIAA